jgi:hypothetical protein
VFFGIDKDLHTLVKEGIGLGKIENIEFNLGKFSCVLDTIEEPLGVARSVHIVLKEHVIFIVCYFNSCC